MLLLYPYKNEKTKVSFMIKKLLLTVCTTLCCTFLYGKQDWKLVWNDEFDTNGAPDNSKWSFDTQGNNWDWGNNEAQNYTPADKKNAWVEDGNLIIEARKEAYQWYGDGETKQYTSARLITKDKGDWLYGKVEVKALLPTGRGMWPAIWMLSTDDTYGGWPNSGEIDIMENVGFDPNKIHCNIHTEAYNHKMGTNKGNTVTTTSPSQNWHIYSMEWDAEKIILLLDGEQVFRFDNEHKTSAQWPYDKRFHLLLNIAVGGGWGGEQGIDDGIFPQRMLVDYVRVYQYGEVEDEPVDGVLTLKTTTDELVCEGNEIGITIDTTGTGALLYPEKLTMSVYEVDNDGNRNYADMSNALSFDGKINLTLKPNSTEKATIITEITYRKDEGVFEQVGSETSYVKISSRPVVASLDSIGPKDVKVVMDDAHGTPSYQYALDRGMFEDADEFHDIPVGEHLINVRDANGCYAEGYSFTINEPTSVELVAGSNIAVYAINNGIKVDGAVDGAAFRIVDANGIVVIDGKLSDDGTIIASSLGNGIYYVLIEGKAYPVLMK